MPNTDYGTLDPDAEVVGTDPTSATPHQSQGIEREIYGKWTLILRNFCGILSVITVCGVAGFNAWTTYMSVTGKNGWPSDWVIITVNVGPIICAWTFLSANKVLATILSSGDGESLGTRLRRRIANVVDPGPGPNAPPQ